MLTNGLIETEPLELEDIFISLESLPEPFDGGVNQNGANSISIPDNPVLQVPDGFTVNVFADNVFPENGNPRWLGLTPTGDVLVTSLNSFNDPNTKILLLRDTDGDGTADFSQVFADAENGLNKPFGMVFTEDFFYVGNTDSIVRYSYNIGDTEINGTGEKIADLPGGGNHFTRNLAISPDDQLFVSIGSGGNVTIEELPRASVQVMNLDGSNQQTFAFGLRNPVGLDFHPITGQLFTTVNERDGLGDDLVPDYFTGLEQDEFYGWPYVYLSPDFPDPLITIENPNFVPETQTPDFVAETQTPDVLFQAHSVPLGLQFYDGDTFPEEYQNGAFVAFRGGFNRQEPTGSKIVFVPFDDNGNATGVYQDFLTGFLDVSAEPETTWANPVGLQVLPDGSLLFTDQGNNRIYRIQFPENETREGTNDNDNLQSGEGDDQLFGRRGRDRLTGNGGDDTLIGGVGRDTLNGGRGDDTLNGGRGSDRLFGKSGNDLLIGRPGNDILLGGEGNDTLEGGIGRDRLNGGAANDLLTGGGSIDRFIFNTNQEFQTEDVGIDTITDFSQTQGDIILLDLRTFTAINSQSGTGFSINSEFATVTNDQEAETSDAVIVYNSENGNLFYNPNGSQAGFGNGGQFATLTNIPELEGEDFFLRG
ncbi:PQQ-dependent sugar dehydrogenase [Dapis sp. BLCC M172]|uniref:PQQ-dependent sugar dehydrogenase n=1 Tax=Dapis sp. BLCC M172 TaxID=2975281 RepID=UPI003CF5107C